MTDVTYIPISALCGDNVVERSPLLDLYAWPTVRGFLEEVEVSFDHPDNVPAGNARGSPRSTPPTAS